MNNPVNNYGETFKKEDGLWISQGIMADDGFAWLMCMLGQHGFVHVLCEDELPVIDF